MQAAVQRCKQIVTGILLSSGEARGEAPEVTNVRDFIEGIAMEWRRANPGMPLRCDFGPHDYPRIVADPVIRQAIGNLLDHAREAGARSEEHTSELKSLLRISYAVYCL